MTKFAAAIAPHFKNVNDQIRFFFFTSISLCLTPPPPSRQKKGGKKENNSYALYLLSKIICDRVFFPIFYLHYILDRPFADDLILLLRTTQTLQGLFSL